MGLPKIDITIQNGALGQVAGSDDGLAALVLSGVAVPGNIGLLEPKQIFSTDEAKALGLDEAYDATNSTEVWKNIKDFYHQAGAGATLWVMLYENTTLMATVLDKANDLARKVLDAGEGKIRLLAIGRIPDGTYTPVYADGLDPDVVTAISTAHALAEEYAAEYKPLRVILDGRDYQGVMADLIDLTGNTNNRVMVEITTNQAGSNSAAVGLALGKLAAIPVQRNKGRVKDGDLGVDTAYLTDGATRIEDLSSGEQGQLHDKGYSFMRKWQGKNGYFYSDDPTAAAKSDDYSSFARGRVIDKAMVVTYQTYVEEMLDDLEVDDDGFIDPSVVKSYQAKIDNALNQRLNSDADTADQNVSRVRSIIDPKQNILSTGTISVDLKLTPRGYNKEMSIRLGFENPALT